MNREDANVSSLCGLPQHAVSGRGRIKKGMFPDASKRLELRQ